MRNVNRAERRGRRHPGRKALIGGLSGALAACVALVQADALPTWLRVTGGLLGALCVAAFFFLYWPKIKAAIPNGEDL